jgi:hypothetical protein
MRATKALFAGLLLYAPSVFAQAAPEPAAATPAAPTAETPPASAEAPPPDQAASADVSATSVAEAAPSDPAAGGEVPLSQAELEALGFTASEGGEVSSLDTDLHVSGFLDFNFSRLIAKKSSLNNGFLPRNSNFYVGNFNVYLTKNLSETFRTMGEVRFTYLPNGYAPGTGARTGSTPQTLAKDYADFDRNLKWGGVEIERVYLEWAPSRYFAVRAGQFLTPYGVWNVDHGSPTFIPVQRPYVVGGTLFPERQTGFELYGRWDATNSGTLGYHVTLSNGGGPISEYRDLDGNKAVGGRLFWEQRGFGELKIGYSMYYGRTTDAVQGIGVNAATGKLIPTEKVFVQYDQLSIAGDITWKWKGLLLQAEYVSQQRAYTGKGRQAVANPLEQRSVFPIDTPAWGAYALVGYRLPWFGIMPYMIYSDFQLADETGSDAGTRGFSAGLNIRPIDAVVLKLEYVHAWLKEPLAGSKDPFRLIQAQIAWAF